LFNIESISKILGTYGQTYTMPDKESALQPYLNYADFEFLKRRSLYCPERGCHVGALKDESIFKMLHCYMRPRGCPLTPKMACAENIDTALSEWANHGRDVYEKRRRELREVATRSDLIGLCTVLDVDYTTRIEEWHKRYAS